MKKSDITRLQQKSGSPSVSIYATTHPTIPEKLQDRIVINHLINQAKDRLIEKFAGYDLKKVFQQLDSLESKIQHMSSLQAIALFANNETAELFTLPFKVKDLVVIDTIFETTPLLAALHESEPYYILAIDEKLTKLYHGNGEFLSQIIGPTHDTLGQPVSDFPLDFLKPSDTALASFGQGQEKSAYKDERLKHFFEFVDDIFHEKYFKEKPLPTLLVGTQKDIAFFKEVTKHKDAYVAVKFGNYTHPEFTDGRLAQEVWPTMRAYFKLQAQAALHNLEEAMNKGLYAFSLQSVWRMAQEGRIHTLFVERGYQVPGKADEQIPTHYIEYENPQAAEIHDDLVQALIDIVVSKGNGKVIFYDPGELAEHDKIAAILRY